MHSTEAVYKTGRSKEHLSHVQNGVGSQASDRSVVSCKHDVQCAHGRKPVHRRRTEFLQLLQPSFYNFYECVKHVKHIKHIKDRNDMNPYMVTNVVSGINSNNSNTHSRKNHTKNHTKNACLHHTSAPFDWPELKDYLKDKILGHATRRVVAVRPNERRLPNEVRPCNMPADREHPWPETIQKFVFELSRQAILEMAGGQLTITFSNCVNRTWWDFAKLAEEGWLLDPDAVCAAMDFEQTWSGVTKIRLWRVVSLGSIQLCDEFEFVRPGEEGRDEILTPDPMFRVYCVPRYELNEGLEHRFTEELRLRHAVVDGVDEYSVG
jgi:hypothetical protein